jgi:hypothetical protein
VGGYYVYYPLMGALSLSPPMVLSSGGPLIIHFYSYLPQIKLFCYFGSLHTTPAYRLSNQSVSCVSPVIGTTSVPVGVGSESAILSTTLILIVAQMASPSALHYSPQR